VVGGGPAGIGAAYSAAINGARVTLLEKNGFLGGNITNSYVETCNYFMKGTPFKPCGVYALLEEGYRRAYGNSDDIRPDSPHRFSSEHLKIYLDAFLSSRGVEMLFHAFVNEVVAEDNEIKAVVVQTKQGPKAVKVKRVIDATGDGDVAFAAGVDFEQGRDADHLCQPGTLSFRVAGANAQFLTEGGKDKLREIGAKFKEDYRSGRTGLSCKRQDLPFGRLTSAGQITYINYPCAYGIDPTDVRGLSLGEMECRKYISEMVPYMKENFPGFENIELSSVATEIGFRDSRRIKGKYCLTIDDMLSGRHFDDCIAIYPQFYDMLSPDAYMDGDGSVSGKGYKGHIYKHIQDESTFQIPYRSLLPEKIANLLIAGRCVSCDHVAESGIRAISACMLTGEAAGAAAALSAISAVSPERIDIQTLQERLKANGVVLP
jgi:hypothetical protein